tara:strand:- start:195 stop:419 length:225 start_codon:yes stop_codon:yes gene_type:complete
MKLPNEFIITKDFEAKIYDETIEEILTADIYTLNIEETNMLEETEITYINHDTGEVIKNKEEILEWLSYLPENK